MGFGALLHAPARLPTACVMASLARFSLVTPVIRFPVLPVSTPLATIDAILAEQQAASLQAYFGDPVGVHMFVLRKHQPAVVAEVSIVSENAREERVRGERKRDCVCVCVCVCV